LAENAQLIAALKAEALRLGFADIGITAADAIPEAGARLKAWLADGCHGDMIWMPERADERASPKGLWPDVKSVIMLGTSYAPPLDPLRLAGEGDTGVISVYAWNRDYHDLIKKRLKTLARWLVAEGGGELKVFVDTAPVMEKPLAAAAGLGWQGKHTNLVSRKHGSWLFLGAIYTTLDLTADAPHADRCGSCTRCQTACPTEAFPAPYRLDARRCLAYLTIEHKGPIPEEFRAPMANRIYGCDDCLAVCPWNRFAKATEEPAFLPRAELTAPKLADLLGLDDAAFRALFSGSAIKRIGVNRFIRNCLYAAGNSGEGALIPAVRAHLGSDDPVVADAARWALERLESA
jgi:epoxyqueuosine reductase